MAAGPIADKPREQRRHEPLPPGRRLRLERNARWHRTVSVALHSIEILTIGSGAPGA